MLEDIPNHLRFEQKSTLAEIFKLVDELLILLSKLDVKSDEIREFIRGLFQDQAWDIPGSGQRPTRSGLSPGSAEDQGKPRNLPPIVNSLSLAFKPDGRAILQIEGRQKILLSKRLAALVAALTVDDRPSLDQFVAWKSKEDLIAELERRLGKQFNRHDLKNLLYLLRQALKAHQEHPDLVMHSRKFGSRFALQRSGKVFVTNDSHK